MANSLGVDLMDKVVLIKSRSVPGRKDRRFRVTNGFGANPKTMGTRIIGVFVSDGEKAGFSGYEVERLAKES